MAHRLDRFHQRLNATRHLLGWFGVCAASVLLAAFTVTCSAQSDAIGLMVRPGFEAEVDASSLPADGWYRVTNKDRALQVQAVAAPVSVPGEEEAEAIDTRYIRVPGVRIAEGRLPTVAFADAAMEGDSTVLAAADIDSDGKPDFIVQVGGQEVLLLSSRTQPGLNPPAAVLALQDDGC